MTRAPLLIDDDAPPIANWIDRLALLIALAIVVARCTMLETIREPLEIAAGGEAVPRGAGATSALVLSMLAVVPAMLVLLRRVIDPTFIISRSFALLGLLLLGGWAIASALWAADAFLAVVSAVNWLSAMTLAWAVAQLVRTEKRARIVAGVGVGLLLIFITQAAFYRFAELPALRDNVAENRAKILADRGWTEDSFEARQFLQKIYNGEMVGFSASANTFAALLVVTIILTIGLALQRTGEGSGKLTERLRSWTLLLAIPILCGCIVIWLTHSRAAIGTLLLAGMAYAFVALLGPRLRTLHKPLFALGVLVAISAVAVIIWRGTTTGTLFHDSLTFRWRYWLGGFRVFTEHPILGVGWENFGPHYLGQRLAIASEEVRDPHNLIVRLFVELGLIGGALGVLAIGRLIWEMTRPAARLTDESATVTPPPPPPADDADQPQTSLLSMLIVPVMIAASAMVLNAMASIDLNQSADYIDYELRKRLLYGVMLTLGLLAGTLARHDVVARHGGWVRTALVIATLLFLLQNLIDFSMFESSGMFVFALLAGSAVGISTGAMSAVSRNAASFVRRIVPLGIAAVVWLVLLFAIVMPIGLSEGDAITAGELRRLGRPGAADLYGQAYDRVSYNADYAYQTARSLLDEREPIGPFRAWIDRAIATNPMSVKSLLLSARVEAQLPEPNVERLQHGYDRAVEIDPQAVEMRLEYAEALIRFSQPQQAVEQMRLALAANAGLSPDEPKRLPIEQVAAIERRIAELSAAPAAAP
ncbi:MAG TPA: O-antigen ligase family protein [Tepidisphaeraceae bacterium]|jgi:O-antigen ligase|nr:O-antigen ligase family protein [Tepidisphaeraceae bacterium]